MRIFGKASSQKQSPFPHNLKEWQTTALDFAIDVVIIFLLVFLIIRPFIVAPFQVQQSSMEPNIHDGEYIIVSKLPYDSYIGWSEYQRGDTVVFRPTTNPETYLIKRIIGLPGETLRIFEGMVWIQDKISGEFSQLDDSYLSTPNQGNTCLISGSTGCSELKKNKVFETTVPADHYFLLGDNRLASRDSRSCFRGTCANENDRFVSSYDIEGRAWFTFYPLANTRIISREIASIEPASE